VRSVSAAEIPEHLGTDEIKRLLALLSPLRRLARPKLYGTENLPSERALLVGNHTIYGLIDLPFLIAEIFRAREVLVRSLGDHAHFRVPAYRNLLMACGMVRGTRANCSELMRRGELVLVFPGGAREVSKRRGEKYQLIWANRLGFARMAIEHAYPIVPFAAVGAEESLDIVLDADSPLMAPVRAVTERLFGTEPLPLVRGIGLTPIPRPQRLYFWFGEPVSTERFAGRHDDEAACRRVRAEVAASVEGGIAYLLAERERG
jgi:1-acyl-sn-glycerol-3-phosphate acyltransferase